MLIVFFCFSVLVVFNSIASGFAADTINIECDSISNYHRGRKYCIIKGIQTEWNSTVTYEPSLFSTMKSELLFDKCKLFAIPDGIFSAFPNLKTMYTWNSGLVTIRKKDFVNADTLRELDVSMNLVTELAESTFFWADGLQYLNLASNRIAILPRLTFHGLIWLKVLNLDGNDIENVWPGTFDVTPRLEMVYLNNNRIRTIDGKLFARNVGLMEVHIQSNNITRLDGMVVAHLKKLISFRVNDNPIVGLQHIQVDSVYTNIRNIGCAGCVIGNRTEKLLASNNRIEYVVLDTQSPKVTELELNINRLTSFQNLTQLKHLTLLDVSENRLNDISVKSFANLSQLSTLRLRDCGLRSINFGLFSYKPRLRLLDISHNQLGHVELIMFTGLKYVRELYLEGNNIIEMDMSSVRQYFPILNTIGLSQNSWNCTNLALAIKILEANHIELNSEGLTKIYTNIKGIPCDSRYRTNLEESQENDGTEPAEITTTVLATDEDSRSTSSSTLKTNILEPNDHNLQTSFVIQSIRPTSEEPPMHDSQTTGVPVQIQNKILIEKLRQMRLEVNAAAGRIVKISKSLYEIINIVSH